MTTVQLTPNFTLAELGGDAIPNQYQANARALAELLESLRAALGVPLRVTSGYRSDAHNAAVGGASSSQHLTASAADVAPVGLSVQESYRRFRAAADAGRVLAYSQVIFYPADGHIHIGLPMLLHRGEQLAKVAGGYQAAYAYFKFPPPPRNLGAATVSAAVLLALLAGLVLLLGALVK